MVNREGNISTFEKLTPIQLKKFIAERSKGAEQRWKEEAEIDSQLM